MAATSQLQSVLDDLEKRIWDLESCRQGGEGAGKAGGNGNSVGIGGDGEPKGPIVVAFEEYYAKTLVPFVAVCEKLGGGAAQGGRIVQKAWDAQLDFLNVASKCNKPDDAGLKLLLIPLQECLKEARTACKRDEWENHTKTISEGLACINWLVVSPDTGLLPKDIAESAIGGSDYWSNRIRVLYKKSNPDQVAFCDTFKLLLSGLVAYISNHAKTGVTWNPKGQGQDAVSYIAKQKSGQSIAASTGEISVSQPPAQTMTGASAHRSAGGGGGGMGSIFGELNKGLNVTKGLKKVTKDQQTWRAEYSGREEKVGTSHSNSNRAALSKPKGPPIKEFVQQGNKWVIENQSSVEGVVTVEVTDIKQIVYIYGCIGATIDIKGKCKTVTIDSCKKTQVLVDDAISSVELVNCHGVKLQIHGSVPSVAIDKTDGFQCYLSSTSIKTDFVTANSSEMNVSFPKPGSTDGELLELPIPEQFIHMLQLSDLNKPKVSSKVSDLYS